MNEASNSKFVSRKSNIINHNSNTNYGVGSEIIYNGVVLKSNLSDYNNASILLRGNIAIIGHQLTQVAFKNCAQFTKYITMIDGTSFRFSHANIQFNRTFKLFFKLFKNSSNYS